MEAAGKDDLSSWAVDQGEDQQPPPLPAEDFELGVEAEQLEIESLRHGGDSLEAVEAQVIELRRIVKVAAELVRAGEQELDVAGYSVLSDARFEPRLAQLVARLVDAHARLTGADERQAWFVDAPPQRLRRPRAVADEAA